MSPVGRRRITPPGLRYRFRRPELLELALTHRSFVHERGRMRADSYERLEFLGDALLGFLVADALYRVDPEAGEGTLTRRKQRVVRAETLAAAARSLGLGGSLRLGRGEESTKGRDKPSLLSDAFEAVLGAVYLDGGMRSARAFVRRHLGPALERAGTSDRISEDYKTRLQERTQARLHLTPTYRIVSREGPPHELRFRAHVLVDGRVAGEGTGPSRKQAEQAAARAALEREGGDDAQ